MSAITMAGVAVDVAVVVVAAADKLTLDEPMAADLAWSSRCENVVVERSTRLWLLLGTTISVAGGGTTEKAFEDATKRRSDAPFRRNILITG